MLEKHRVTSMAGVPYTYEMLRRMRLTQMDLPHLKTLTQAGGHLKEEMQGSLLSGRQKRTEDFYNVRTDGSNRSAGYIPPSRCLEKFGSIGIPIPGGRMELAEDGEIIYYGTNVSMATPHADRIWHVVMTTGEDWKRVMWRMQIPKAISTSKEERSVL